MNNEDLIEEHKRKIAISIIECLDNLVDFNSENITIKTTHNNNPKYYTVEVSDKLCNKIGINIHKLK